MTTISLLAIYVLTDFVILPNDKLHLHVLTGFVLPHIMTTVSWHPVFLSLSLYVFSFCRITCSLILNVHGTFLPTFRYLCGLGASLPSGHSVRAPIRWIFCLPTFRYLCGPGTSLPSGHGVWAPIRWNFLPSSHYSLYYFPFPYSFPTFVLTWIPPSTCPLFSHL